MPILSPVGRSTAQRLFVTFLYGTLSLFGLTMAIPFLITLTSSGSNAFDYDRFSILPRSLWSPEDRFVKGIVHFINDYPGWFAVLGSEFSQAPAHWTSWRTIGNDRAGIDRLARYYLEADEATYALWQRQAADYAEFSLGYPLEDTLATFTISNGSDFIEERYTRLWEEANPGVSAGARRKREGALELLSRHWEVPMPNFYAVRFEAEMRAPLMQQSWMPPVTAKQGDYEALRHAIRHGATLPGVESRWNAFLAERGETAPFPIPMDATQAQRKLWLEFARETAPASPALPFPMRLAWIDFLRSDEARRLLRLQAAEVFDIARYNAMAGTSYETLEEIPFPLPAEGFGTLTPLWQAFVENRFPLRLTSLNLTPELQTRYEAFLAKRYPTVDDLNRFLDTRHESWSRFRLEARVPIAPGWREIWMDFVKSLPAQERVLSSSEIAYQRFLLEKYGSLEAINTAYGWKLERVEEALLPFDKAYAVTYRNLSTAFAWHPFLSNYLTIGKFLLNQGNAIPVTLWLIILSIVMTLTVNPIAGYALSRFNLRGKDKIILFCLATSAFPAMVSAIPGYLLMRDLGMLNTFFALVLPGAASGMSIFILKGFFDSLPQELYEAATIDGAREWQIFSFVTLPMIKPILAVNALNAFMAAYAGWEWALIICQDPKMWTLSVWLYQASQWWANTPWITTAGFVVASIPTLVVFLFCQNIIMRGIIVPSMK